VIDFPPVFDDPLALRIVGEAAADELRLRGRSTDNFVIRTFRSVIVARARVAEDELRDAIASHDVRQYVILGAGLDTFAYRNPYPHGALTVFEVDHPSTQAWKHEMLRAAALAVPSSVHFVGVDFEKDSLLDLLVKAGLRRDVPTFFSWLGVTMYLSPHTTLAMLKSIASWAPAGSGIVFDYALRLPRYAVFKRAVLRLLTRRFAQQGEPWIGLLDPCVLADELLANGFSMAEVINHRKLNAMVFEGRCNGLRVPPFGGVMRLRV